MKKRSRLWLSDFDGTIKPAGDAPVCRSDLETFERLKDEGFWRVVATGRSLFGFIKAWPPSLRFDALIFSSGAGLCLWDEMGPGPLWEARCFSTPQARLALAAAEALGYGFFAFEAPPDNHHFYFQRPAKVPAGFERRLEIFANQCRPWSDKYFSTPTPQPLSQLLIMIPAPEMDTAETRFHGLAPGLSTLRSSSPFGDGCLWLEVFAPGVDKGRAAAQLARRLGLEAEGSVALGNDYNDETMLSWAEHAFITDDAPASLRTSYETMPAAGRDGQAWVLNKVLGL